MDKIFGEFELWIRGRVEIWKRQDVKEDSCYLIMNDGYKIKLYSGYQDKEGITLGKYLISKNGNKSKYI